MSTKKPKTKKQKSEATYLERGHALKVKSNAAEFKTIGATYKKFDVAANGIKTNAIDAANLARELGIHLQTLAGREILSDKQGKFLWDEHFAKHLPFSYDNANMFVSVARKMTAPAKTLNEAVQFVQQALIADNLLQLPERAESQSRSAISVMEKFLAQMTLVHQPFKKILAQKPMETWDKTALNKFLSETEWIAEERERAEKFRKEKV
jgi:hypothetical protein